MGMPFYIVSLVRDADSTISYAAMLQILLLNPLFALCAAAVRSIQLRLSFLHKIGRYERLSFLYNALQDFVSK